MVTYLEGCKACLGAPNQGRKQVEFVDDFVHARWLIFLGNRATYFELVARGSSPKLDQI